MSLSELFQESKGGPVILEDGRTVVPIWQRDVPETRRVFVRRLAARESRAQALRMKVENGTLLVNEKKLTDVVLWADTSPPMVEITVQPKKKRSATLKVWNAWRDDGVMQAWLGNAGMLIEETPAGVLFRCSDGVGEVDVSDLVVELSFSPIAPDGSPTS